jgi:hypothetical protein
MFPSTSLSLKGVIEMSQQWYLSRNGSQYGPYSWNDLQNLAQQGNISRDDLIWSNSLGNWTQATNVPNLLNQNSFSNKPSDGIVNKKNPLGLRFSIRPRIRFFPGGKFMIFIVIAIIVIGLVISYLNGDLGSLQMF